MSEPIRRTSVEVAKALGFSVQTFRNRIKQLKLVPETVVDSGKRGRPADLWTAKQVATIRSYKVKLGRPRKDAK